MKRRDFITVLGGAAAWPLAAPAQQPAVPVVGWLDTSSREARRGRGLLRLHAGLQETGYREGQNVAFEYRWADWQYDRLPSLAADLVRRQIAVIFAIGAASALAAKAATTTIPIVFSIGGDPVSLGLVSSLNRPGGNLTGFGGLVNALGSKQLQLLRELAPGAKTMAYLVYPANPNTQGDVKDVQAAAGVLRLQVNILNVSSPGDIDLAFATIARQQLDAVLVANDGFLNSRVRQIAQLALIHRVPTIFPHREAANVGGLTSYGPGMERPIIGVYVGRILKGEKPGDLPVVQATEFEFVINLITAKSLGLTVPPSLLAIADEVIERSGAASSLRSSAARRPAGRSRRGRSKATACGASACSRGSTKTILRGSLPTLRSRRRLRTWVGAMAATCGWTLVGAALTSIGYERSRGSWSACNPTSF
jgi:putative ABC transport system substrate-binding protein